MSQFQEATGMSISEELDYLQSRIRALSTAAATPGGADMQIQYNNAGVLAGNGAMIFDLASQIFAVTFGGSASFSVTLSSLQIVANTLDLDSRGGTGTLGDVNGAGNNTKIIVNDAVPSITLDFHGTAGLTADNSGAAIVATLGDPAGDSVVADDLNGRVVLSTPKPVLGDTTGLWYVYNTFTNTYWSCRLSILGALITADTTSASLP